MDQLKKYFPILVFMAILLQSCVENPRKVPTYKPIPEVSNEDYLVINATFHHLVFPPLERLPGQKTKSDPGPQIFGYHNFEYKKDRLFSTDTAYFLTCLPGFDDTLYNMYKSIVKTCKTEFQPLLLQLNEQYSTANRINLKKITNTGTIVLIPLKKGERMNPKKSMDMYAYSNIIYNNNHTKACFYFDHNCFGLCGSGNLIFAEKIDGIWTIIEQHMTWVS